MSNKPKVTTSAGEKEVEKLGQQFDNFEAQVKSLTVDEMNKAPIQEFEPQTKMSNREANNYDAKYIKPVKNVNCREKFNETYRSEWEHRKQYVRCIVENNEIRGDLVELWSKPYAGVDCEFWQVPPNKPVCIPRHLAEQIARKKYHRLVMDETKQASSDGMGTYYGQMAVSHTIQRLDARPVGNSFVSMVS